MENCLIVAVLLYYISLVLEIAFVPVPSVSSTWQLIFPDKDVMNQLDKNSNLYKIQQFSKIKKGLFIIIPYLIATIGYCFPILYMIYAYLFKIELTYSLTTLILGILLLIIGRWITISSALGIRKDNSQKDNEFDLKTEGIFRHSRNPIVLGLHVGVIGLNILIPSILFIALTIVYMLHIHFKILLEEDFLKHMFGADYSSYFSKTKRYL